ncbi:MAG: class I SAM-dependent methyltransferase [Alphaproteobacteria bacterium]|nr:class I SAM-dependent methyltransferase [Alphaproteobacteria bacterium]
MKLALAPNVSRFKRRFHAWWEGYDYVEPDIAELVMEADAPADEADDGAAAAPPADAVPIPDAWTAERVRVSELIWGDGFNFPGGAEAALDLIKPFALSKEKTLLDVGCGLGGGARAVAKSIGAWVEGLEPSATLAVAGMHASEAAGMGKKATVQHFDPQAGKLPTKRYDAVFVRQVLGLVTDKPRLIKGLSSCVKPGGQIMFVELALAKADGDSEALQAWRAVEDAAPHPPTVEFIAGALSREKVDVRIAEDFSPTFKAQVLAGWASLADQLQGKEVTPEEKPLLARELDLWAKRIAACEAGDLKIARVSGIKKA